jgi:hypothetical protein
VNVKRISASGFGRFENTRFCSMACGGSDSPGNMQWLSAKENRAKGAHECGR